MAVVSPSGGCPGQLGKADETTPWRCAPPLLLRGNICKVPFFILGGAAPRHAWLLLILEASLGLEDPDEELLKLQPLRRAHNDVIEAGLVEMPRVVVRDDGIPDFPDLSIQLKHPYDHVRDDLNRNAQEHEPCPAL